jgi:hypothetical protein
VTTLAPAVPGFARTRRAVAAALGVVQSVAIGAVSAHKASLRRLADIPLTVAGTGCIDFAAWHVAHGWGWLVTGISLVLIEHLIADDE